MVDGGIVAKKLKLLSLSINDSVSTVIQVGGSLSENKVSIRSQEQSGHERAFS